MPTYDYQCRSCGAITELIHSMLEPGPSTCDACGGDLRRVLYPTGIIFKGSGFYRNDSRAAPAAPASGGDGTKTDSAPASANAASKGDAKPAASGSEGGAGSSSTTTGTTSEGSS